MVLVTTLAVRRGCSITRPAKALMTAGKDRHPQRRGALHAGVASEH